MNDLASRTDDACLMALPSHEALTYLQSVPQQEIQDDQLAQILADPIDAVRAELSPEEDVRVRQTSQGRGAEVLGAALEITTNVSTVYGIVTLLLDTARTVKRAYDALHRKLGQRPLVSLGTARALAAAEVAQAVGHDEFMLVGSGDVTNRPTDYSFTGEDAFWVIFQEHATLHTCLVESDGRVHFLGTVTMHDNWISRFRMMYGNNAVSQDSDSFPEAT